MQGTYVACVSVVLQQGNQLTVTNWFALHMFVPHVPHVVRQSLTWFSFYVSS